jgi:hypothetical protein
VDIVLMGRGIDLHLSGGYDSTAVVVERVKQ